MRCYHGKDAWGTKMPDVLMRGHHTMGRMPVGTNSFPCHHGGPLGDASQPDASAWGDHGGEAASQLRWALDELPANQMGGPRSSWWTKMSPRSPRWGLVMSDGPCWGREYWEHTSKCLCLCVCVSVSVSFVCECVLCVILLVHQSVCNYLIVFFLLRYFRFKNV